MQQIKRNEETLTRNVTYFGQDDIIQLQLPLFNGKQPRQCSFGFSKFTVVSKQIQPLGICAINVICKQLIEVFSVKGSQHNLVITLDPFGVNGWTFQDSLPDEIKIGVGQQQITLGMTTETGASFNPKSQNAYVNFSMQLTCQY